MQGDRDTSTAFTTVKCTYDHDTFLLSYPPLQTTLTSNEGHLLLALIEGVTDKEDLISRVWGDRGLIVSDSSYYKALHSLRHYLSEVGLDRSILKTLPRRGVVLLLKIERVCGDISISELPAPSQPPAPDREPPDIDLLPWQTPLPAIPPSDALEHHAATPTDSPAEQRIAAPPPPRTIIKGRYYKASFYLTLLLGIALPVNYAYMMFSKPVQLEGWRLLWEKHGAKLYVERGEKTPLNSILSTMAIFGSSVGTTGTNYFVKKTLSVLLVNCEKPESKGEALCTNYLIIEQKK